MNRERFYFIAQVTLIVLPTLFFLCLSGCGDKITVNPEASSSNFNFGAAVYEISRSYLSQTPPQQTAKLKALEGHRMEFIDSINTIIPDEVEKNIIAPLKMILPLVDDGSLPQMTRDLDQILKLLSSHPQDPGKETLASLAQLFNGKGLSLRDWSTLLGRLAQYKEMETFLKALSKLIQDNDGVDSQGNPNGEKNLVRDVLSFLSRKLKEMKPTPAGAASTGSSSLSFNLGDELLNPVQVRGNMGPEAYAVKLDTNGNPAVAKDPTTQTIFYPFVDKNNDGIADVDAYGRPIDQNGQVLEITPFGKKGNRSGQGLAVAASGSPVYEYFDAKKTLLGVLVQLLGVALEKKVPGHGLEVLKACLGKALANDNGTPTNPSDDYFTFSADNPVHDIVYGLLEIFKSSNSSRLLDSFQDLTTNNSKTTEQLLITMGKVLDLLKNTQLTISRQDLFQLIEDMIPLLEEISKKTSATSPSTMRLLLQSIHDIGQAARDLPKQLATLIRYKSLQPMTLVDFNQPAGTTNRSSLHQLLALLDAMDQCTVPLINQTLTYMTLDMMAGMTPQNVKNLVLQLDGLLGAVAPIINALCPGFTDNRKALNDLAMSGALDAFLPIAKVFKDKGELRLLINILRRLYASYPTLLRKAEPTLAQILESGAIQNTFDLLSITTKWKVPGSTDKVADVVADCIAELLDSNKVVYNPKGLRVARLWNLLYTPIKAMDQKISQAGKSQDFEDLTSALLGYITERVVNDNGTPNDTADDFEELKYANLLPLMVKLSTKLSSALGNNVSDRIQKISDLQKDWKSFASGRDFYTIVDLLDTLEKSSARDTIYNALINLFSPQTQTQEDAFGAFVSVAASLLQCKVDSKSIQQVAWFLGEIMDPEKQYIPHLVRTLNRILEEDEGKIVLTMLRNTFQTPASGYMEEPLLEIYFSMQDVYKASVGNPSTPVEWKSQNVEDLIQGILNFMNNQQFGLEKLYEVIRKRKKR